MDKILITGTGRSGTTFLIKLFSFLDYDTGYNKDTYMNSISKNCNSGMERKYTEKYYILKNPSFIVNIANIMNDKTVNIKQVIITIRDYNESANSRARIGRGKDGGLWNAKDKETQQTFYAQIISNYVYFMTKYEINTIFIDFDKMVNDKEYLFNKLKIILDEKNINFTYFSDIYDEVSLTSKPLNP
jgi:hypothetical protein